MSDGDRSPVRPRWHERQVLDADDLRTEQAYRLGLAHRHEAIAHTWGIVSGLVLEPRDDGLVLRAGSAVDPFGRELVVPADRFVPWTVVEGSPPQRLDAWLLWYPVAERGPGGSGTGRVNEEARLRLTVAGPDPLAPPWTPPGRSDADIDALAALGPDSDWPVYLGRLERADGDSGHNGHRYVLPAGDRPEAGARPYAGLRSGRVDAVSGTVQLRLDESPRAARVAAVAVRGEDGALLNRLAVDAAGRTTVDGNAGVGGDVHLAAGDPPGRADRRNDPALRMSGAGSQAPPATPAPWRLYRCTDPDGDGHGELRVELAHPAGKHDPRRYQFTVGGRTATGTFAPCLAVAADGTVHVTGDLRTGGAPVVEGPIRSDPADPDLLGVFVNQWLRGMRAASTGVDRAFPSPPVVQDALTVAVACHPEPHPTEGQDFGYRIEVRNTSPATISSIRVLATEWLDQNSLGTRSLPDSPATLAAGAVQTWQASVRVPEHSAGRTLTVSGTAVGLTRSGAVAYAAATLPSTVAAAAS